MKIASLPQFRSSPTRVFLLCSGLGHINRGYETFTQECFDALHDCPELDLLLFKGGGSPDQDQRVLWNLPRDQWVAKFLAKISRRSSYFIEQMTFFLALIPRIARLNPQVIYFSDANIGNFLWHWRRLTRKNYQLLLSNSAPYVPPFLRYDYVQQVTAFHYDFAIAAGESAVKHCLVPYGIRLEPQFIPVSPSAKTQLREQLGLPTERPIIISVAALNIRQKRVDYLISEVARLDGPRPFLLLLGQQDEETPAVLELAREQLGAGHYAAKTVSPAEVANYYRASDLFVLASLEEGFGRVFLEAMAQGLPCLAHDYGVPRYVLGEQGYFCDFTQAGTLAKLIQEVIPTISDPNQAQERHGDIYRRFGWEHVRPQYIEMLQHASQSRGQMPN